MSKEPKLLSNFQLRTYISNVILSYHHAKLQNLEKAEDEIINLINEQKIAWADHVIQANTHELGHSFCETCSAIKEYQRVMRNRNHI